MHLLYKTKSKINNKKKKENSSSKKQRKFFAGFKTVDMIGSVGPVGGCAGGRSGAREPGEKYLMTSEGGGQDGTVNINPPSFAVSSMDKETVLKHKKKQHSRFSRVVRAVLFETSLAKKIKRNKILQKLHSLNGKESVKFEKYSNPVKKSSTDTIPPELPMFEDDGSSFHTLISMTLSEKSPSVRSISSKYEQQQERENLQENGKGSYSYNTGLCLLLVSMFALVLFGKPYAIICTLAWLYCVPCWNNGNNLLLNTVNSPEEDHHRSTTGREP